MIFESILSNFDQIFYNCSRGSTGKALNEG